MTQRHFCTYFDERYFARGMAMLQSVRQYQPNAKFTVLCLSRACEALVRQVAWNDLEVITLDELEGSWPALCETKSDRTQVEYYFTCTPFLLQEIMGKAVADSLVTYLDADLYFFSSPEPIFAELGAQSVAIIPHRFPPDLAGNTIYGEFNVGWMTFRQDVSGRECLQWWAERCAEWCYDRVEPGRFADQKYLDEFSGRFAGVHVVQHPGANLAPWSIRSHQLSGEPGAVLVDDQPLIFFHFHGFQFPQPWLVALPFLLYQVPYHRILRKAVVAPWLRALRPWERRPGTQPESAAPRIDHNPPVLPQTWRELTAEVRAGTFHVRGSRAVIVKLLKNLGVARPPERSSKQKKKQHQRGGKTSPKKASISALPVTPPQDRLQFNGDYTTWESASAACGGYAAANILETTRDAMRKIVSGEAVYERDSVLMDVPEYPFSTIAGLLPAAARQQGKLSVLDFGGALASTYFACRPWLDAISELHWCVVEQAHYVDCGQAEFSSARVSFHKTIAEAVAAYPPDVILLSGSLHFLPQATEIIEELCRLKAPYILLERTPYWEGDRHRIVIQHVPAEIYEADYPCWLFSEPLLLSQFSKSYQLLASYPALDVIPLTGGRSYFKGMLLGRV
jgi:putative methyltransferase (TIGR04325 family)